MVTLVFEYLSVLIYLIFCIFLSVVILMLSYLLAPQRDNSEKVSSYECGFSPFEDARKPFDIKFYLVSILFIIFDLEVSFLFPWVFSLASNDLFSFWTMFLFLFILTAGFFYEWKCGAIDW